MLSCRDKYAMITKLIVGKKHQELVFNQLGRPFNVLNYLYFKLTGIFGFPECFLSVNVESMQINNLRKLVEALGD